MATATFRLIPPWDKLLHGAVYGMMALLLRSAGVLPNMLVMGALVLGVGLFDELHQLGIPGREASSFDLLADGLGITVGLWVSARMQQYIVLVTK